MTRTGNYTYMCTRNNNFSNRSQRGTIVVTAGSYTRTLDDDQVGYAVGAGAGAAAAVVLLGYAVLAVGLKMGTAGAAAATV